ncbi:uncharacterized protein K460DRAFT_418272 [Cucurbitaria berberidis CBS 394.84]|uniref:Fungal N-terminal domain-containing protein n=1 Tax=Cucurbitaria berberidis CBS 394.84 TaxID=1168544 RepID=A0A9P4L5X1_9PLEO|nr:uncharacterized protein K460DRAFT_418272 [Cucurbitaria berberidis CBS 394.84]KAF1843155.1 hypothetical protein K460DRAFT_418272 [Cucurbitaria berberidis CBS 394.84]
MSALSNLSIASNVLQIVGFSDTVFHAGKTLYELLDKARSATKNITLLLPELQVLLSIVALVHVVITEHASSPFAQDDGHTLPNIHTILTLIEQDLRHLRGLLGQSMRSGTEGWFSLLQSNIRWALKDHDITAARYRLARYTQSLNAALSITGRRHDIVLRAKLQHIEDRVQAISLCNPPRLPSSGIYTQSPSNKSTVRVRRRQVRVTRAPIQSRNYARGDITKASYASTPLQRRKNGVIIPHAAVVDEPYILPAGYICPKINVVQQEDQTLFIDTGNYDLYQFTKPASLLRDFLAAAFHKMRASHFFSISDSQLEHLEMLLDCLVASAHTASAQNIAEKYDNCSKLKSLKQSHPIRKYKDARFRQRSMDSSSSMNRSLPFYPQEKKFKLDTIIGFVQASILSARSFRSSRTLAVVLQYYGNEALNLLPFAVEFASYELMNYLQPTLVPTMHTAAYEYSNIVQQHLPELSNSTRKPVQFSLHTLIASPRFVMYSEKSKLKDFLAIRVRLL